VLVSSTELFILERLNKKKIHSFQKTIYAHYKKDGRRLPWRKTVNPYHIVVSEIMLQQTQVDRVVLKYKAFITTFPNFKILDKASLRDVLSVWQGLGYNRRAQSLKKLAHIVVEDYRGQLPRTQEELVKLPGIGPYTAGAILAFAHNKPSIFVETNIRTVFIHFFFPKKKKIKDSELLPFIEKTLDRKNPRVWYSALMDYGTYLKEKYPNPSRKSAHYTKQGRFEGSDRQIRGAIITALVNHKKCTEEQLTEALQKNPKRIKEQLQKLEKEDLLKKQGKFFVLV